MNKLSIAFLIAAAIAGSHVALAGETPSTPGASVSFVNIKDGDTLTNPVTIKFALQGMEIAPAGTEKENTGHHHLIIDGTIEGEALNEAIPSDDTHKHFGKGQTEMTADLPAGTHTLQLVLGDWSHIPHNPPVMSDIITVTVK